MGYVQFHRVAKSIIRESLVSLENFFFLKLLSMISLTHSLTSSECIERDLLSVALTILHDAILAINFEIFLILLRIQTSKDRTTLCGRRVMKKELTDDLCTLHQKALWTVGKATTKRDPAVQFRSRPRFLLDISGNHRDEIV